MLKSLFSVQIPLHKLDLCAEKLFVFSNPNFSGWWLNYPSEKWWTSSVGIMTFPIHMESHSLSSLILIAWSQRVIKTRSSWCAVRSRLFSICPSKPMSYRSSMVSSSWSCNRIAVIFTLCKKRSCWSKMRMWSAAALRAARSMNQGRSMRGGELVKQPKARQRLA